ncbi:uncharacterized protein BDV14DRAFT_84044 [Aspergillus stella-maris]|uniref:uncharacterized protein n=1 Tax=Aspergillus stella-maris TaxID=1810926 RepID=UPI003CCD645E
MSRYQPSHSLEGMEQVVPPSPPFAHTISRLHLDKPLPDIPARSHSTTPAPYIPGSTAWSDDSSTVNSFDDHLDDYNRNSSVSTESYPVFVRPGSADLADFVDHRSVVDVDVSTLDRPSESARQKPGRSDTSYSSLALSSFLAEEDRYTPSPSPPSHWNNPSSATRSGPNHYFREKKFDFFPELAPTSALPANSPHSQFAQRSRNGKKVKDGRSRWIPIPINIPHSDKGAALAHDFRNSFRNIQRRLSRNSLDKEKERNKNKPQPTTAPSPTEYTYNRVHHINYLPSPQTPSTEDHHYHHHNSNRNHSHDYGRTPTSPTDPLYVTLEKEPLRISDPVSVTVSVSPSSTESIGLTPTGSSISDQSLNDDPDYRDIVDSYRDRDRDRYQIRNSHHSHTRSTNRKTLSRLQTNIPKQNHLAVPITPYQRYGAAIWDKSGKEKKRLSYTGTPKSRTVRFPRYRRKRESGTLKAQEDDYLESVEPITISLTPARLNPTPAPPRGGNQNQNQNTHTHTHTRTQSGSRIPLHQGTRHAVKALQDGTSHVLIAIDGARRKIAGGSGNGGSVSLADDLRRTQLKSQIRLIGPVNPYTHHSAPGVDPWV